MDPEVDFCLPTEGGITARYIPIYETALPGVVFDESLVAISAFGGLIAVARHPNRWAAAAVPDEPAVRIFTPAGKCQAEWRLDDDTLAVAQLAWTHAEKLVVLSTSGAGHVLDVNATVLARFSLWSTGVSATVTDVAAAGNAVAIVSKPGADLAGFARRDSAPGGADDPGDLYGDDDDAHAAAGDCIWIMPDVEKPALRWALPLHPHTPATAEALALLPTHLSDTGEPEVLIGLSTASLLRMSAPWHAPAVSHVRQLSAVPQAVRWAPSGQHIALFLENGMVDVFTDGFDQHILRADSGAKARGLQQPDSFEWAGDQTIAVAWLEVAVDMVSLQGQVAHCLEGIEAGLLGAELDGVRVVGHDGYGLLQLTPPSILSTLSLGETSPAADLCDALEALDDDGDAEETVETLVSEQLMTQAVTACVATALHATLPHTQKRLLSAAAFGKAWDPAFDAPAFTAAAKTLRVLNTLREPAVAMPLTWPQWRALGVETVVDRLLARRQHALALRLVEFQPLPSLRSRVLEHWAIERVITAAGTVPDEELVALICDQLRKVAAMPPVPWALRDGVEAGDGPGLDDAAGALSDAAGLLPVRFADVAAAADAAGHRHLATVLLEQEKRPAQQVPLLLKLRQHDRALKKAVQSKDPNLVHMTVLHLQRAIPREELISLLARFPMAARLAAHFSEFQDPAFAEDLYEAWGQHLFWARSAHRAAYDIGYAEATGGDVSAAQVLRSNRLMGSPLPAGAARTVVPALLGEAADRLRAGERPNGKALGFYAGAVERHRALIAAQEQLDAAGILPESSLVGLPLHSTLVLLVSTGADKEANKLRSAQDVDDAVWHRLRVRGYVVGELWGSLKSAAGKGKTRSFPVPPQYVVRVLAENGHSDRAASYAELIPDQEERIDTLMQLGKWGAAADLAASAQELDRLAIIAQKASTPAVQQQAAAALSSLQG